LMHHMALVWWCPRWLHEIWTKREETACSNNRWQQCWHQLLWICGWDLQAKWLYARSVLAFSAILTWCLLISCHM
jgi:hypothetical protein